MPWHRQSTLKTDKLVSSYSPSAHAEGVRPTADKIPDFLRRRHAEIPAVKNVTGGQASPSQVSSEPDFCEIMKLSAAERKTHASEQSQLTGAQYAPQKKAIESI